MQSTEQQIAMLGAATSTSKLCGLDDGDDANPSPRCPSVLMTERAGTAREHSVALAPRPAQSIHRKSFPFNLDQAGRGSPEVASLFPVLTKEGNSARASTSAI